MKPLLELGRDSDHSSWPVFVAGKQLHGALQSHSLRNADLSFRFCLAAGLSASGNANVLHVLEPPVLNVLHLDLIALHDRALAESSVPRVANLESVVVRLL